MSAQRRPVEDLDDVVRRLEAERFARPIRDDRPLDEPDHVKRARLRAVTAELDGTDAAP